MKPKLPIWLIMLLLPLLAIAQPNDEILRIKIDWLNAKECGIDGCKPQSIVLRNGGSVTFQWLQNPERGVFELSPLISKEAVQLSVKRIKKAKESKPEVIASKNFPFQLGEPKDVQIDELAWKVTITTEGQKDRR